MFVGDPLRAYNCHERKKDVVDVGDATIAADGDECIFKTRLVCSS